MKILIVADTYYPHINGCAVFSERLANEMKERGHDVAVIAPSSSFGFTEEIIRGIRVFGVRSITVFYQKQRYVGPFFIKQGIRKILNDFKPDIIHLQSHFFVNRTVFRLAKEMDIPIIATNHFMPDNLTHLLPLPPKMIKKVDEWMWRDFAKIFNQIKYITTPTEIAADLIRPRLNREVSAISCGIDTERFNIKNDGKYLRERYNIPDKPVLLYVGRIDPEKRVDEVVRAVKEASSQVDFCFVIAGIGMEKKKIKALAESLGIGDRVIFTGFVPDVDLPNIYALSRCFVNAGVAELQSIVTMEAMATGLPVIAVNANALPELAHDGRNGFLFEPGDIGGLTERIVSIFSDDEQRKKFGAESLAIIGTHERGSAMNKFENLYQEAVKRTS